MRPLYALVTVLSAALCAAGAPVPKAAEKPTHYFPTTVGDKWDYAYLNAADKDKDVGVARTVLAVQEKQGVITVQIGHFYKSVGKFHEEYDLEVSANGILQTRSGVVLGLERKKYDPPRIDLKLPHKDGQSWDVDDLKETCTAFGPEEVKVPAGTFQAIRVEHRKKGEPKSDPLRTYWYAPRVGIVKVVAGDIVIGMKSFTPGKG